MQPLAHRGVHDGTPRRPTAGTRQIGKLSQYSLKLCGEAASDPPSEYLGQSVNLLRRRIDELERQLGTTLLTRHVDGVRTTTEGDQIFGRGKGDGSRFIRSCARTRSCSARLVRRGQDCGHGRTWRVLAYSAPCGISAILSMAFR